ncbi:MAG TPA: thioether cross-link-forming SCIFF peptide maturase [Clostridiaceae bacterium]|nr:thioether cross-link-forming SCIFF peptide maturase [Clostridiaceae bacterium]
MVHIFNFKNDVLVYDTETQALLEVDELAAACLRVFVEQKGQGPSAEQLVQLGAAHKVAVNEVKNCVADIESLIADGILFAPEIEVSLDQIYPDQPVIKSMCLHICHDCNLRCRYCFAETGDFGTGERSFLDIHTGRRAIDFLIAASGNRIHLDVDFFGGEPLLNWPVVTELVDYCEKEGPKHGKELRLTITTNGVLLDDEKIDYINAHFKNVVLSLDGRPEVQNQMRPNAGQRGSYDVVMPHIRSFVAKRGTLEHYVRGTFTRLFPDFSQDVIHMADSGLRQLSMEPVVAPPGSGYDIREEDLPEILTEYERLAEDLLAKEGTPDAYNFFHFNIDLSGGPCLYKRLKGCGVGTEYCAVTPEGDIYPCHQFVGEPDFKMGNVHEIDLADVYAGLERPHSADFEQLILPDKDACKDCWARYYCSGGCAANAWHATGDLNGIYDLGCVMMRKRLECALWLEAKRSAS